MSNMNPSLRNMAPQNPRRLPVSRLNLSNYKGALAIGDSLYFGYGTTQGSITTAASTTGTDQVQIQADAAFLIQQIGFVCFQGAGFTPVALPPLMLQLTDSGSGATLFSTPLAIFTVAFGGQAGGINQFQLPTPRLLAPSSLLNVSITNLDSGNAYTTRINFQGQKIYSFDQQMAGV